jgi:hypothetical protein
MADLQWVAREVLRDADGRAHLLTRITLSGTRFQNRDLPAFVTVGSDITTAVRIAPDELSAEAYFAGPPPAEGQIAFGYGVETVFRFPRPFTPDAIQRLDRRRLPPDVQ